MKREQLADYIFDLIPQLHRKMFRRPRHCMTDSGKMPRQQMNILTHISHHDGMPMKHYGEKIGMSKPNMTKVANSLIEEGYVTRGNDPDDRRIITLHITVKGQKAVKAFYERFKEDIIERTKSLSDEDVDTLIESFENIQTILGKLDDR